MLTPSVLAAFNRSNPKESILDKFLRELSPAHSAPTEVKSADEEGNSTVKSVYFESAVSQKQHKPDDCEAAMQVVLEAREPRLIKLEFNVLVVGGSGTGKTTFIHSLLVAKFGLTAADLRRSEVTSTHEITHYRATRRDSQLVLSADFVDTPGASQFSTQSKWLMMLKDYIDVQAMTFRQQKLSGAAEIKDTRVHLCLYLVNGPSVSPFDAAAMKALQAWVSVLPVISKSDLYTPAELAYFRRQLNHTALTHELTWFDCRSYAAEMLGDAILPFAVSSFLRVRPMDLLFSRKFPWGLEEDGTGDFDLLAGLLLSYFVMPAVRADREKARQWRHKVKVPHCTGLIAHAVATLAMQLFN
jgi:GTP-binding protein EngB required for normal cell division